MEENYLKDVRQQYELLPYPPRKPDDTFATYCDNLENINYSCFDGKEDFNNFNVLVAGCGTGDSLTYLAMQLKDKENSMVYALDFSEASLKIAKSRAEYHKLTNIVWIRDSLLNIPKLKLPQMNYINCTGVLHHLSSPTEGLRALQSVLKPKGCMFLMVYAQFGRTGVYQMQDVMRRINGKETDITTKVNNTKKVLQVLPSTNWFKHSDSWILDHKSFGNEGIYDLLLHSQDRCYSVEELYEFVEACNLRIISFSPADLPNYDVKNYNLPDSIFNILPQSERERQQIAEILSGSIMKHEIYVGSCFKNQQIPQSPSTRAYIFIRDEINRLAFIENRKPSDDALFRVLAKTFKFYHACSQMKDDHEIIKLVSESCKKQFDIILDTNKIYGHSIADETFIRILNDTCLSHITPQYVIRKA
jgi:ubiquinone/menaquinone biosynthesis C-methylase UbiE